ncbi:MAG: tetratricopeptide repeat protein [Holophagales bacterium]|nr:tetratricopeptide repeat protein [Holophagales bacterium]
MSHDDHLPPPPQERPASRGEGRKKREAGNAASTGPRWGDRILFAALGALVGFAGAWVSLEGRHTVATPAPAMGADPNAGVPGAPPMNGPAAAMPAGMPAVEPAARQRLQDALAVAAAKPGDYDALVQLGNAAYDVREFAQAADAYERALKLHPDDANVMTDLGTAYRNEGQFDKALELFRKARASDPKHWQSLYNEVIVLAMDKHDHEGADAALARLKKEHPGLPALAGLEQQIGAVHAEK